MLKNLRQTKKFENEKCNLYFWNDDIKNNGFN